MHVGTHMPIPFAALKPWLLQHLLHVGELRRCCSRAFALDEAKNYSESSLFLPRGIPLCPCHFKLSVQPWLHKRTYRKLHIVSFLRQLRLKDPHHAKSGTGFFLLFGSFGFTFFCLQKDYLTLCVVGYFLAAAGIDQIMFFTNASQQIDSSSTFC